MSRAEWYSAYRAARMAYKAYDAQRDSFRQDELPQFLMDAWDACPGYSATRLLPESLAFCTQWLGVRELHTGRMLHLRRRVRLPA